MMLKGYGVDINVGASLGEGRKRDVFVVQLQWVVGITFAGEYFDGRGKMVGGIEFLY